MAEPNRPPQSPRLVLTDDERAALERIAQIGNRYTTRRARLLLLSANGAAVAEVSEQVGVSGRRVRYWRRQFQRQRMSVFSARLLARLGRPAHGVAEIRAKGLSMIEKPAADVTLYEQTEAAKPAGDKPRSTRGARATTPPANLSLTDVAPGEAESARQVSRPGVDRPRRTLKLGKAPGVQPDDPMSEAGRKVLYFHFERMLQHEPGTRLGEDIEALHDMRVATRRMRAAFNVFGDFYKPRALKMHLKGLRAVGRALGAVRDLDVFMEKVARYQAALPEDERGGMEPLLDVWDAQREKARAKMIAHLNDERFACFVEDFAEFLTTPDAGADDDEALVCHVVPRLVYTCLENVRRYETGLDTATIEMLHALRIDFKRLRYTLEFFEEVLGAEARAVIDEVKLMQDHLGDLNDAHVAEGILQNFIADYEKNQAGVLIARRRSIDRVIQYMADRAAEKHRLMVTFPEAWARFNRIEVRRALAAAVAIL